MELTDFNIVKEYPVKKDKHYHLIRTFDAICPKCNNVFTFKEIDHHILKKHNICKSCVSSKHKEALNRTRLYGIWASMKHRIQGKNKKDYIVYKEKNIKICKEWAKDYTVFSKWALSNGYKDNLTIDRIDNDKDYMPSNCRWVSQTIQNRNQRLLRSSNTSGYRGIEFRKDTKKWTASITVDYKKVSLGCFKCRFEAIYARDKYIDDNNLEHTKNFN